MSIFLEEFAELLSRVRRDANVSRTWSSLAPLVCKHAGEAWRNAGIWLYDYHDNHVHLTLWHWWSSQEIETMPEYITSRIECERPKCPVGTFAEQLRQSRISLEGLGFLSATDRAIITPIIALAGGEDGAPFTVGMLVLFGDDKSPALDEKFANELAIACGLVGSWMHLNREWRKASALAAFQPGTIENQDSAALARSAVEQLCAFASAQTAAAIYVPRRGILTRIAGTGGGELPASIRRDSFLHRFHFGEVKGFRRAENLEEVQIEFDADGNFVAPEYQAEPVHLDEFPEIGGGRRPVSVLVARVKEAARNGTDKPPIATLMMATSPGKDFLGGRFSDTNRAVMRLILGAFRNRYALALQADGMEMLASAFEDIGTARAEIDINDDDHDIVDFARFVDLALNVLPNVADAAVVFSNRDGAVQHCWLEGGIADKEPPWLGRHFRSADASANAAEQARWVRSLRIEPADGGQFVLHLQQTVPTLPVVEQMLLDRIIAEMRIEQRRLVNKDDWARQLAEVRHNMRAVLASVIGKVDLLGRRYEVAVRSKDSRETHRRLVIEGSFRKNIRQAVLAGKELEAIFENIRALVGKLDENSLQISSFDLSNLIRNTLSVFDVEADRRDLKFHFVDNTQSFMRSVTADPIWTRIALFNLLENAIKYSDRNNDIMVILNTSGGHWQLKVENIGRYIPVAMRDRIFEAYERVRHAKGLQSMPGTGLGLMTLRQFVALHQNREIPVPRGGKSISVESEPLERNAAGEVMRARTSFTISIPRKGPDRNG